MKVRTEGANDDGANARAIEDIVLNDDMRVWFSRDGTLCLIRRYLENVTATNVTSRGLGCHFSIHAA